jgi:hypothetical protein
MEGCRDMVRHELRDLRVRKADRSDVRLAGAAGVPEHFRIVIYVQQVEERREKMEAPAEMDMAVRPAPATLNAIQRVLFGLGGL